MLGDLRMSHVTYMNESRHTYEGVTSHIWMNSYPGHWMTAIYAGRLTNESCHIYESVLWHIWLLTNGLCEQLPWPLDNRDICWETYDSLLADGSAICLGVMFSFIRVSAFIRVTYPLHRCEMTHPYVQRDLTICAMLLIHIAYEF